jgi:Alpha amylase, catalytic domain
MRRLDYLHGLGVTALWLMPFQPSPGRDDGYDISDYFGSIRFSARLAILSSSRMPPSSAASGFSST